MLLPTLSVTVIGVLVGLAVVLRVGGLPGAALPRGIVGAWVGFLVGALVGVLFDVMLGDGIYVFIIGHAGALAGAVVAVGRLVREAHHTTA